MIRKLELFGLATLAVLAIGATVASVAQGANFTASKYPTAATATSPTGNDVFKTEAGLVECAGHFNFDALSAPSATVTVTPTYTKCQAFGLPGGATVSMNGCDYVFHSNEEFDIECPAGKYILIQAGPCELTIATQTDKGFIELSNGAGDIIARANVSYLSYVVIKDSFGCPFNGTGIKQGSYIQSQAVTVQSTNGATIDIG